MHVRAPRTHGLRRERREPDIQGILSERCAENHDAELRSNLAVLGSFLGCGGACRHVFTSPVHARDIRAGVGATRPALEQIRMKLAMAVELA